MRNAARGCTNSPCWRSTGKGHAAIIYFLTLGTVSLRVAKASNHATRRSHSKHRTTLQAPTSSPGFLGQMQGEVGGAPMEQLHSTMRPQFAISAADGLAGLAHVLPGYPVQQTGSICVVLHQVHVCWSHGFVGESHSLSTIPLHCLVKHFESTEISVDIGSTACPRTDWVTIETKTTKLIEQTAIRLSREILIEHLRTVFGIESHVYGSPRVIL
jgi:hypothetical protein